MTYTSYMEKDVLPRVVVFVLSVLLILLLAWLLPDVSIGRYTLRPVDLLADLRPPAPLPKELSLPDTLLTPPRVKPVFVDTCRTGLTCIEDYSDSTLRGMSAFYRALDRMSESSRPVRIAYFGDSFIEGDILTADLREMLQLRYGGCGVGFVPIASSTNGFRPTVRHAFEGWQSHAVTDTAHFDHSKQGISGHYFIPRNGAYVELHGQKTYASRLDTCLRTSIFFQNRGDVTLVAQVNRSAPVSRTFGPSESIQQWVIEGHIGSVRWTVESADSTLFYGVALDGAAGISVDNFSLRGASGLTLRSIPRQVLADFARLRPYDLIVLQYGLNVATEGNEGFYATYVKGMAQVLDDLKHAFPEAGILVVSVGDRDQREDDGTLHTLPAVKSLVRYQQHLAADNGVAFWNLFQAMGGEGSMAKLVDAQPAQANRDYTHINFRGGRRLARLLYDALEYGKEQYDKRRQYEEMD